MFTAKFRCINILPLAIVFLISALLLATAQRANAQSSGNSTTIKGHLYASDKTALSNASVMLRSSREGTSADSMGNYTLTTQLSGKQWVIFSSIGYKTDSLLVELKADTLILDRKLSARGHDLSTVTVQFRQRRIKDVKQEFALTDMNIVTTPGAGADVASALRTLPGAAPAGNETGLFVHGGAARETQAYFDGMLVKNPFGSRLPDVATRSRFSAFLFKETAFSTTGYSAQFGQALSSVLSLETKGLPGKTSNEFSLTTLGGGAAHTQRFKNSSLTVGANYYNFDFNNKVFGSQIPWVKNPEQIQTSIQYKAQVSKTGMLKTYADYSNTRLSFDILNPNTTARDFLSNTNSNIYLNTNYQDYWGPDWKFFAGAAYNYTREKGNINQTPYEQTDQVWHEKITVSRYIGQSIVLLLGTEQFQSSREEGYALFRRNYNDVLSAGFTDIEVPISKKFNFKAGGRFEYSAYLKKQNLSPRVSLAWYPAEQHSLLINWGTYFQKPDDSYLTQTNNIRYEKATNYNLDYQLKLSNRNLRIQVYYKDYTNLIKITTPVYSGFQAYGPPLVINMITNNGYGYAKGLDIFWRDAKTIKGGEFYTSYSFIDTKRNYIDYPTSAQPAFVPTHTANFVGKRFIPQYRTQVSATYTFSSGRPYFNPNNPTFLSDRTRNEHNLSLGLSYLPAFRNKFTVINFSVNNVLGIKNIYGYRYSYDGLRRESILPPNRRGYLISLLMNIGDGWFNH